VRQARQGAPLEKIAERRLIVVAGPTASGKSGLAAALARRLGGEIVGADSRQVYRFLDAATAKPSPALRAEIPHHLIDVADPGESYDAGRFARQAADAIAQIRSRGRVPIVCGGTGLYLRALLEGLTPLPPRDAALRAALERRAEREGREALHAELAAVDPAAAAGIAPRNLARVIRALEIARLTGRPASAHWAAGRVGGLRPSAVLILEVPTPGLDARIAARARAFWPALLEELRALVPARFAGTEPGFSSLGYREALAVLRGELAEDAGLDALIRATRAYAKRQRTWLRGQLEGVAVDAGADAERTLSAALAALEDAHEKAA
jgi:tRNA dimethylallyltransferase